MDGGPKINANPVILAVDKTVRTKKKPLGWSDIEAISANLVDDDGGWSTYHQPEQSVDPSPEDRAVLQALTDVSAATDGKGVSLLKKVGIVIPDSRTDFPRHPVFVSASRYDKKKESREGVDDESKRDAIDADEIFEIIRNIQDPEHPVTLEQLGVVSRNQIEVRDLLDVPPEEQDDFSLSTLKVRFTPTVPHCSMATLIGLCIRVKLLRSLPPRFKVDVSIEPGSHQSENSVNKQLADKERVCAALENPHLLKVVNRCILNGMTGNMS